MEIIITMGDQDQGQDQGQEHEQEDACAKVVLYEQEQGQD